MVKQLIRKQTKGHICLIKLKLGTTQHPWGFNKHVRLPSRGLSRMCQCLWWLGVGLCPVPAPHHPHCACLMKHSLRSRRKHKCTLFPLLGRTIIPP